MQEEDDASPSPPPAHAHTVRHHLGVDAPRASLSNVSELLPAPPTCDLATRCPWFTSPSDSCPLSYLLVHVCEPQVTLALGQPPCSQTSWSPRLVLCSSLLIARCALICRSGERPLRAGPLEQHVVGPHVHCHWPASFSQIWSRLHVGRQQAVRLWGLH